MLERRSLAATLTGVLTAALWQLAGDAGPLGAARIGELSVRITPIELAVQLHDANPAFLFPNLAAALYPGLFPNLGRPEVPFSETYRRDGSRLHGGDTRRPGTVADGESRLLVAVRVNAPGTVSFRLRPIPGVDVGEFEVLQEYGAGVDTSRTKVLALETKTRGADAFALYRPPRSFDPAGATMRLAGVRSTRGRDLPLEYRLVQIDVGWKGDGDVSVQVERTESIAILRPPVVLVHGTYDSGAGAWDWPDDDTYRAKAQADAAPGKSPYDTPSFARQLEELGFAVFVVNYPASSGEDVQYIKDLAVTPAEAASRKASKYYASHFTDNARVVWDGGRIEHVDRGEGIEAALAFFRDGLNVAATRADVVGHSMGAVLPRVYSRGVPLSQPWDRPGPNWYLRPDNWGTGDINRLISIGATHRGSHVPRLASQYWKHLPVGVSSAAWAGWNVRTGFKLGEGAATDQDPVDSKALEMLGPTRVPTHAIAGVGTVRDLDLFDLGFTEPSYRNRFMITWPYTPEASLDPLFADHAWPHDGRPDAADLRRLTRDADDKQKEISRTAVELHALEQEESMLLMTYGHLSEPAEMGTRRQARTRPLDDAPRRRLEEVRAGQRALRERIPELWRELARLRERAFRRYVAATFWNDWTDYTSSLDSQLNGQAPDSPFVTVLPLNYKTACEGVLHGYEPRHTVVQKRVIALLKGGMDPFAPGLGAYKPPRYLRQGEERWTPHEPARCEPPVWEMNGGPPR
jgi:hypothetical protein